MKYEEAVIEIVNITQTIITYSISEDINPGFGPLV